MYHADELRLLNAQSEFRRRLTASLDDIAGRATDISGIMAGWASLLRLTQDVSGTRVAGLAEVFRKHPVARIAWQDPLTAWAYRKPRGHAGDARLMDFVYDHPSIRPDLDAASTTGRAVHAFTFGAESPVAMRERRRFAAHIIDEAVEQCGAPEVLAVGCGHLREAELSQHIRQVGRLVALDQDGESLAEIHRAYRGRVELDPIKAQVEALIAAPLAHGRFDLIYAAGLYDRLDEATARGLTAALFAALKPGGHLFFTSFTNSIADRGYLDIFMDWRPILREEAEIQGLLGVLSRSDIAHSKLFRGNNRAIAYASVRKRMEGGSMPFPAARAMVRPPLSSGPAAR